MNTENVFEAVNKCFNDFKLKNKINLSKCDIAGSANISNISQNTLGTITANCMAKSKTFTQATKKFLSSMGTKMKSETSTSNKSKVDSSGSSKATAGFGASGSASLMGCIVILVAVCLIMMS